MYHQVYFIRENCPNKCSPQKELESEPWLILTLAFFPLLFIMCYLKNMRTIRSMKEVVRSGPVPDKLMHSQESLIRKYLMGQLVVRQMQR